MQILLHPHQPKRKFGFAGGPVARNKRLQILDNFGQSINPAQLGIESRRYRIKRDAQFIQPGGDEGIAPFLVKQHAV